VPLDNCDITVVPQSSDTINQTAFYQIVLVWCKLYAKYLCHQQPTSRVVLNKHQFNLHLKLSIFTHKIKFGGTLRAM